jgi:DNA-binding transcriptional LysR family regulator
MEIRHLRYVIALAEELHFGRAAKQLNVSQPPLSQQLMKLEKELGVKLFERTKHKVTLTAAGIAFVAEARSVLALVDHAATAASRTGHGEMEQLIIGTLTSTDSGFYRVLIKVVERFAKHYPNVRLGLRSLSVPQQIRALKEDRIQIGFVALPIDDPAIAVEHVYSERFAIAMPEGHRLASKPYISTRLLANERQIDLRTDTILGRAAGIAPVIRANVLHEARTVYDSLVLVSADMGLFLIPASFADVPRKGIVVRKLNPSSVLKMGIAFRKDNQAEALISFLRVLKQLKGKRDVVR